MQGMIYVLKIVIADRDMSVCHEISDFLSNRMEDAEIFIFDNPDDTLKHLSLSKPDIVITDVFAPEPRCAEIINFCESYVPDTNIILMSRHKIFSYAHMAVRCRNVVDFLTKPMDMEYLYSVVNRIINEMCLLQAVPTGQHFHTKRAEFFSDIVHGHITNPDDAAKKLDELGLNIPTDTSPCLLTHFHISDFSAHIRSAGSKDSEHFYEELASVVPFETSDAYISLTSYSHGNISWFIVQKNKNDILAGFDTITDYIRQTLFEKMSLNTSESSRRMWISLRDMINVLKAEEQENASAANTIISEAIMYMRRNYHKDISLKTVAEHVNVSPIYFSSYFKKHTGENFVGKLTDIRIQQAAKLLVTTDMSIRDIKLFVGYKHTGNFYNHFRERYGRTPSEYKEWYFEK